MRSRHVNRQCGPRGPNTGTVTSERQKIVNKAHFEQRGVRSAEELELRSVLQRWLSTPVLESDDESLQQTQPHGA